VRTFHFDFVDDGYSPPTGSGSYSFEMKEIIYIPPDPPDPLPGYYGFVFRDSGYSPPTGSGSYSFEFAVSGTECPTEWIDDENDHWPEDSDREWGVCSEPFTYLKQIWTDENYVYAATTDGLNIIDMLSEVAYAHVTYAGGFNSVWADASRIYLATPASGVKYIDKASISGSIADPYELFVSLRDYLNEPDILSDKVRYLHGNSGRMIFSTASGVDYRGPGNQRVSGFTKIARKVFITSTGKMYYVTWDGTTWKINIKSVDYQDWTTPDKTYQTGTFLINGWSI